MTRYDKFEPYANGFRVRLAADFAYTGGNPDYSHADLEKPFGVGLDSQGRVVKGAGQTGIKGILVLTMPRAAGDVVDVMTDGECLEWNTSAGVAGVAGTNYSITAANGLVVASANAGVVATGAVPLGFTAEVSTAHGARCIVRVGRATAPGA